jgi:enamine deaminase RidA (YjgF/YER057c/UK114 family)
MAALGIVLPRPWQVPVGLTSAAIVRRQGHRLIVSGHVPLDAEGRVCGPYGKVGAEVTADGAAVAARRCMLAVLASVQHALGSLAAVESWTVLRGYVNSAPGFSAYPAVLNPASDLLLQLFDAEAGAHARVALGVAGLPFDAPVEIEAELQLRRM